MLLEAVRIVKDGLAHATYGVNAQLDTLDVDAGDSVPADIATIIDETRNDEAALHRTGPAYPALLVSIPRQSVLVAEVMSGLREGEVEILVRYYNNDVVSSKAVTDAYYTARAIQQCIHDLNSNTNDADRQRNNIQMVQCVDMTIDSVSTNIDDGTITQGTLLKFRMRDITP